MTFWRDANVQEFDEDELEAELDALGDELELEEQEELDKQLLDVGPAVPTALPEVNRAWNTILRSSGRGGSLKH